VPTTALQRTFVDSVTCDLCIVLVVLTFKD